ncbi:MAG TPA: energy transducer TonB [Steroidobacteraceae bacterium]|nr:energy transducer TonB [Steroidobacteraceae bacterium]
MNRHDPRAALPATGFSRKRTDRLAQHLLQRAAHRAPPELAERLEEEWLADLAVRRTALARLRLAVGCCWAASVIAREHGTRVAATATARGPKAVAAYAPADSTFFSRRSATVLLILALHAVLIYLLTIGIVHRIADHAPQPIIADVNTDVPTHEPPPPLPRPDFRPAAIDEFPVPDHDLGVPAGEDTITVSEQHNPVPVPGPAISVQRLPGGPGQGFPRTADYYPDAALRLGEQGSVAVQVCVAGNGRLTSDPTIAQSSGSARLDGGALALAKAGSGHYRPATEDGRPVSSCFPFRIRFEMK